MKKELRSILSLALAIMMILSVMTIVPTAAGTADIAAVSASKYDNDYSNHTVGDWKFYVNHEYDENEGDVAVSVR